ncbi:MAG TPA: NlpC/P60 family protein [Trebonia sp.]|nr:NlpC/P60 family protein [Trebonia sp.]
MGFRLASTSRLRGGVALAAGLTALGGLAVYSGAAGAAPQPTIAEVQSQVNSVQAKVDRIGEEYDQANEQLTAAKGRLGQVNQEVATAQARYAAARTQLAQVAVAAYENSGQTSILGLLTSGNPGTVLGQASLVTQVAGMHNAQATKFLGDAQLLASVQQQRQRTEDGVAALRAQLVAQKTSLSKLLASRQATLDSLTAAQQAQVAAATVGATGTTAPTATTGTTGTSGTTSTEPTYTGSTSTQAEKAVAFAYAQLGKPYEWGATGPYSYDCSGLVQAAWAAAGVSIPRVTYDQWAALPHIATSSIQPGDLLYYDGEGHVAMYVGDGYIIDAPRTGLDVEKIPMNTDWYAATFDGAVRP